MATTITPAIGNGALFTQQGVGTEPGYSAIDDRRAAVLGQEGAYGASDFMVVQRGIGANMSVDVGMPAGGFARVQGDSVAGQGLYTVPVHSSTINEAIAAADPTNPRVDQVILEVLDNVHDASGSNLSRTRVLTGTATAGATLANRTGAAALPSSALLLADVLVGNGVALIDNAHIRDRRTFARGGYSRVSYAGGTVTKADATVADIAAATGIRLECSGVPLEMTIRARGNHNVASVSRIYPRLDAVTQTAWEYVTDDTGDFPVDFHATLLPSPGSHLLNWGFALSSGGTLTLFGSGTPAIEVIYREDVRQNTANNSVTSG